MTEFYMGVTIVSLAVLVVAVIAGVREQNRYWRAYREGEGRQGEAE